MSPHLVASDGRAFTATRTLWESALFLAEKHGWEPAGTEPPPLPEDVIRSKSARGFRIWERMLDRWEPEKGYTSCVGALVTGPDGRAMGGALAAALDDVPDQAPPIGKMTGPRSGRAMLHPKLRRTFFARPAETLGAEKEKLRALIAFLLVGEPFRLS